MKNIEYKTHGRPGTVGRRRLWLVAALCLALAVPVQRAAAKQALQSQSGRYFVSGKVTDQSGAPMAGVTVQVEGTYSATATNPGGEYHLDLGSGEGVLVFSFVGYQTLRRTATAGAVVNVVMEEGNIMLEEIVKVAYGSQKRESVTGAISSIGTADLAKSSSANITNALSGRIAGLTALQSGGGQPGYDDAVFYLRGIGTTDASRSQPLIMIDGIPRDNFSDLDPNEVESVSVLKDASATAVFGVRGANGVILITTRRGKVGKPELSVSFNQSWTQFTKRPKRLHSLEYLELHTQAIENNGATQGMYSAALIDMYKNPLQGLDPTAPDYAEQVQRRMFMYPDHDNYKNFINDWTPQTRLNANVSGGTDKVSYFINIGYLHQGSNFKTESKNKLGYDPEMKVDRWSFRTNLDYKISESVKTFLNVASYIENRNMPHFHDFGVREGVINNLLGGIYDRPPITPGYVTIPGYGAEADMIVKEPYYHWPPYYLLNRIGFREDTHTNINSSFGLEWDLGKLVTKGLSVRGSVSYDNYAESLLGGRQSEYIYIVDVDPINDILQISQNSSYNPSELQITRSHGSRYTINAQAAVDYRRTFAQHSVTGLFLAQRDYWEAAAAAIPYNVIGIVGRLTYDYDSRYFAEFNMGYNGSEQFAPKNRFGFFPAFSAGWVLTNEKFYKQNEILNYLKLRGSWGKVGNDKIGGDRFLYLDNLTVGGGDDFTSPSLGKGQKVYESYFGNPAIQWEVATKINGGVDLQLFRSLRASVDVYSEKRRDILITRQSVPYFQGISMGATPRVNMGAVDSHGYEVELNYNKEIVPELWLGVRGNLAYNTNKVVYFDEVARDDTYAMRYERTGYTVGQQTGYLIDYSSGGGYWTSVEEIANSSLTYTFGTPRPGDFKYVDVNGDGVIDDKDIVPIGYSNEVPRYNYGFGIDLNWKGIDLSVFFHGVAKFSNYYGTAVMEFADEFGKYWEYTRRPWTPERWANGEKITYPALSSFSNTNHTANSFFIMDRSFLRLKNLELGYTLPGRWTGKAGISNLRVFVSGQNLFIWDKIKANHIDPEMRSATEYPITRTVSFGCNLNF